MNVKKPKDRRTEKVNVPLTEAERKQLLARAGDTPLGKFIRELALKPGKAKS